MNIVEELRPVKTNILSGEYGVGKLKDELYNTSDIDAKLGFNTYKGMKFLETYLNAVDGSGTAIDTLRAHLAYSSEDFFNSIGAVIRRTAVKINASVMRKWGPLARLMPTDTLLPHKMVWIDDDGGTARPWAELTERTTFGFRTGDETTQLVRYGDRWSHSDVAQLMNSDFLNVFDNLPLWFNNRHIRMENMDVFRHFLTPSGVNTNNWNTTGYNNIMPGNPVFNLPNLQKAIALADQQREDFAGSSGYTIVIPPALRLQAEQYKNILELRQPANAVTGEPEIVSRLPSEVSELTFVVVNEFKKIRNNADVDTMWWVIPNSVSPQPVPTIAVETYRRDPGIFIGYKQDQYSTVGNVGQGRTRGDIIRGAIEFASSQYFNSEFLNPVGTLYSAGTGS